MSRGFLSVNLTSDSSEVPPQLSPRRPRGMGPQAVTDDMNVPEASRSVEQSLDEEAGLGGHHPSVGDRLVVIRGFGSIAPSYDDDVELSL